MSDLAAAVAARDQLQELIDAGFVPPERMDEALFLLKSMNAALGAQE